MRKAITMAAFALLLAACGPSSEEGSVEDPEESAEAARMQVQSAEFIGVSNAFEAFRDCPECPQMVVLPSGSFRMGCLSNNWDCFPDEFPAHGVTIAQPFAMGAHEVTFAQWEACVAGGGCGGHQPDDRGWGRGDRPVIDVSWEDARAYASWLSSRTGHGYRLPSESEWEYAARSGMVTKHWWGDEIGVNRANCAGCGSQWDGQSTAPVGSFAASPWGLHDMHGNLWEWVEDCHKPDYEGAPADGSALTSGDCAGRVLRGGSWDTGPRNLHSSFRGRYVPASRSAFIGFRVARTLTP
ncbi:MAG: formylglycine-generating enzyme family protein [Gammaproteobacteria bacterium]|nr:formylglycine-generating enzyme family protein [Gammaproteobacteria bacterium]